MNSQSAKSFHAFLGFPSLIALAWVAFQLYVVVSGAGHAMVFRSIHVAFAMALVFASKPIRKGAKAGDWYDIICILIVFAAALNISLNVDRLTTRIALVDPLTVADLVLGTLMIVLLFEAGRRVTGLALTLIALAFVAYGMLGGGLPGLLGHQGISWFRLVETMIYSTTAIFGSATSVSAAMVFYFLLFGAFLNATPAGQLFMDLSNILTRKSHGGAGKAAVVAGALFGMISGSASANTVSVGNLCYPAMKKSGFNDEFSASILAIGGTGGQLIPPIMGAAAFLMMDYIGVPYATVMIAAIIPSIVYLGAMAFLVHFEALRCGLKNADTETEFSETKRRIVHRLHLMISIVVLVVLIINGRSLMSSATWATIVLLILCALKKDTRIDLFTGLDAFVSTAKSAIVVAMPCAIAGVIIGVVVNTGLGMRFSSLVVKVAGGNLLLSLLLIMLMTIVLGMGMPTSAAYIMAATLLAPALIQIGVPKLVAHFFIFYFANLSMLTPPVALASYAAASLAGLDMWKVGIRAFILSLVIFLLPFASVYNNAILMVGAPVKVVWATVTMLVAALGMSAAVIGHGYGPVRSGERAVLFVCSMMLIIPEVISSIVGLAVILALLVFRRRPINSPHPQK
jgi:TRAP transporter 4TM/12TM fusion protein